MKKTNFLAFVLIAQCAGAAGVDHYISTREANALFEGEPKSLGRSLMRDYPLARYLDKDKNWVLFPYGGTTLLARGSGPTFYKVASIPGALDDFFAIGRGKRLAIVGQDEQGIYKRSLYLVQPSDKIKPKLIMSWDADNSGTSTCLSVKRLCFKVDHQIIDNGKQITLETKGPNKEYTKKSYSITDPRPEIGIEE